MSTVDSPGFTLSLPPFPVYKLTSAILQYDNGKGIIAVGRSVGLEFTLQTRPVLSTFQFRRLKAESA